MTKLGTKETFSKKLEALKEKTYICTLEGAYCA